MFAFIGFSHIVETYYAVTFGNKHIEHIFVIVGFISADINQGCVFAVFFGDFAVAIREDRTVVLQLVTAEINFKIDDSVFVGIVF